MRRRTNPRAKNPQRKRLRYSPKQRCNSDLLFSCFPVIQPKKENKSTVRISNAITKPTLITHVAYANAAGVGDATINYVYAVRGVNTRGVSTVTQWSGEFDFALVPGNWGRYPTP